MRRCLAPAAVLVAAAVLPASAEAHGLVGRSDLPIPEWLFGWAAALVLIVSFVALAVLWPRPRLEKGEWRPLPGGLGKVVGSRPVQVLFGALGVAALVAVVAARASVDPGRSSGDDSVWSDRGRLVRAPLHAGPGAWRASVLPR